MSDTFPGAKTAAAHRAAKVRGALALRYTIVMPYPEKLDRFDITRELAALFKRHGVEPKSIGSGICCLTCTGYGSVDDGRAIGCVRSTMPCPDCEGRGNFITDD